jgi:hypothetical protein
VLDHQDAHDARGHAASEAGGQVDLAQQQDQNEPHGEDDDRT